MLAGRGEEWAREGCGAKERSWSWAVGVWPPFPHSRRTGEVRSSGLWQSLAGIEIRRKERRKTPANSPFAGLLPNAFADGECLYDRKHHIVGYDLWNLRGLLCAGDAAKTLGNGRVSVAFFGVILSLLGLVGRFWKARD